MRPAHAQTFTVLHNFTGFPDGKTPRAGLSMDSGGNLYGTTSEGGDGFCDNGAGCGTVFSVKRTAHGWVLGVLQTFIGANGLTPLGRVVFGPDGALYGTTQGGGAFSYGTVFRLTPPPTFCHAVSCPWRETLLHDFQFDGNDGFEPTSEVVFDPAGNIYGTTQFGGTSPCGTLGCGTVYKLTRGGTGWTYSVIHDFDDDDGAWPWAGVTLDHAGNLYGTTQTGGPGQYPPGLVFELTPSGGSWQETVLHIFNSETEGSGPTAGVILDQAGNLYGGTINGGTVCGGRVFELTPTNGMWDFSTIYCFPPQDGGVNGPFANLTMDSAGNLYGTNENSTDGCGEVFKLSPQGGSWTYTTLHSFQSTDGCQPESTVLIDANGNLFGTAKRGGTHFAGVVWEITP